MAIRTDFASFGMLMEAATIREVPLYQRRYSWQPKQIEALWGDLVRLYTARRESRSLRHFIGPLILGEARSRGGLLSSIVPVIDGQQRLMTLSLMICVIRDYLTDDEGFYVINDKYLEMRHGNLEPELRLIPGQSDHDSYFEAVQALDEFTDPQSTVARAYDVILELLARGPGSEVEPTEDAIGQEIDAANEQWIEGDGDDARDELPDMFELWDVDDLLASITEDLELAIVSDVPEDRAYEIFETLNASGMPLSQVDLVRNMIFVNTPNHAAELYRGLWQPMESALGVNGLDAYLHCWIMVQGHNVSRKNTYSALVEALKGEGQGEDVFAEFLQRLSHEHDFYLVASLPKSSAAQRVIRRNPALTKNILERLKELDEWGSVPLEPVLFLIVQKVSEGIIDSDEAISLLEAIQSLVVRRYICGVPPNDLRSSFARLARDVARLDADQFGTAVIRELNDPGRRWPTDSEVKQACKTTPLYRNRPFQCFFVLRRIAQNLQGREVPAMPFGTAASEWSVEHLMPQTLSEQWKRDLKSWGCREPMHLSQELGGTIGNLTITAFNADLSNAPFPEKQRRLRERRHRLELSEGFLSATRWSGRQITARSQQLAKQVVEIWPKAPRP